MTSAEYNKLYREARNRFPIVQQLSIERIQAVYTEAGKSVSKIVADAELSGQADLTIQTWAAIRDDLNQGATSIAEMVESETPKSITTAYYQTKKNPGYALIDSQYVIDTAEQVGSTKITRAGLANVMGKVNDNLLIGLTTRQQSNGLTFAESVWNNLNDKGLPSGVFGDYQYRIENIINAGLVQKRDPVQIAKDIELYVQENLLKAGVNTKGIVFKPGRWGQLEPGTGRFIRRVASRPDWRAIRLVRSELYSGLQQASIQQGLVNVAATQMYNWRKTRGNPVDPDGSRNASGFRCIDLEEFNPYTANDVPGYQHSNCSCSITSVLRNGTQFKSDLKAWVNGESIGYIDDWYNNIYLVAQL